MCVDFKRVESMCCALNREFLADIWLVNGLCDGPCKDEGGLLVLVFVLVISMNTINITANFFLKKTPIIHPSISPFSVMQLFHYFECRLEFSKT